MGLFGIDSVGHRHRHLRENSSHSGRPFNDRDSSKISLNCESRIAAVLTRSAYFGTRTLLVFYLFKTECTQWTTKKGVGAPAPKISNFHTPDIVLGAISYIL
jgi:hypothetical protein